MGDMVSVIQVSDLHHGWTSKTAEKMEKFFINIIKEHGEDFILLVCGDLIATRQRSFKKCIRFLRRMFPSNTILIVRGNHDFWDINFRYGMEMRKDRTYLTLQKALIKQREICEEEGVVLLDPQNPYIHEDIIFLGFDGWHYDVDEAIKLIGGRNSYNLLLQRAKDQMAEILDFDVSSYRKSVLLTHFPPYECIKEDPHVSQEGYLPLTEKFDYLFCGHTHQEYKGEENGCILLNAGSGAQAVGSYSIKEQWKCVKVEI